MKTTTETFLGALLLLVACETGGAPVTSASFWPSPPDASGEASAAAPPPLALPPTWRAAREWKILAFGDVRPDCARDSYGLEGMQVAAAVRDLAPQVDLTLGTGDYLCARPWEAAKARTQMGMLKTLLPPPSANTLYALGNHEEGHGAMLAAELAATPAGRRDFHGELRVVWLPSDRAKSLTPAILESLLEGAPGRLIVVRHEPWGACGTSNDAWIRDRVRAARPSLIVHGHIHTVALPGDELEECGRRIRLGPREVIMGNGGAPGFAPGWAGYGVITLPVAGPPVVRAYDALGGLRFERPIH
jgi:hypothetical protein